MKSSQRYRLFRLSVAVAALFTASLAAPSLHAQSASEVVPEDFAPALDSLGGTVSFSGEPGTQAPPGAEAIGVSLSGVNIIGAFEEMGAANAAFEARLTRGRIPVSELFDATADLERAYVNGGFVLARVILVAQDLTDGGVLNVKVVDGFVEAINAEAVPAPVRKRVEAVTAPLLQQSRMAQRQLERRLLLAADTPGLAMTSALSAGQQDGGTVLTLDGDYRRFTGFANVNNSLSDELGEYALNLGAEANSLLGKGEVVYLRFSSSIDDLTKSNPPYRAVAAGFAVPIGISGLLLNAETTLSSTRPQNVALPTSSDYTRHSLRLSFPFLRGRAKNWSGSFVLDVVEDSQDSLTTNARIYEDQLTVARLGTAYGLQRDDFALQVGATLSFGLDVLGARSAADAATGAPLSRQGADSDFSKIAANFDISAAMGDGFVLALSGGGQLSLSDALPVSEQFGIGGSGRVSGVNGSELRGDHGLFLRAEMSRPLAPVNNWALSPYAFVSFGVVGLEQPTAVETASTDAVSAGFGIDLMRQGNSQFSGFRGDLEVSFREVSNGSDDASIGFSLTQRF